MFNKASIKDCLLETTKKESENKNFSQVFCEALSSKDFSNVEKWLADDASQILYDSKTIYGKNGIIEYWKGWLERWKEPSDTTKYEVKMCNYYEREVLSIIPFMARELYQIARIDKGKVIQLVLCPNPLQYPTIRYWSLDCSPLLFGNNTIMPHEMGTDLEPRKNRIPCIRCGCKSDNLQWYEYLHNTGPLGYKGELSICSNCMEAVEFHPTILIRYQ